MSLPSASVRRRRGVLVGGARQEIAQIDGLALVVGQLDADHVAARHGRDPHRHGAQRAGDVVGERDHAGGAGAGRRLQLVQGDHRTGPDVDDLAADAEIVQHLLERARGLGERRAIEADAGALARLGEEAERRQLELALRNQLGGGLRASAPRAPRRRRRRPRALPLGRRWLGLGRRRPPPARVLGRGDRRIDRPHQVGPRPTRAGRPSGRSRAARPPTN